MTWVAPFLLVLLPSVIRSARWLWRAPRCPRCSALIRAGAVTCRRCEQPTGEPIDVSLTDLFDRSASP